MSHWKSQRSETIMKKILWRDGSLWWEKLMKKRNAMKRNGQSFWKERPFIKEKKNVWGELNGNEYIDPVLLLCDLIEFRIYRARNKTSKTYKKQNIIRRNIVKPLLVSISFQILNC